MKYLTLLLLSASMILITSCKYLLLKYEGIKQPSIENQESLSKFLWSKGIDTTEILCFKDTVALNNFYLSKIGMPEAVFFNREKRMVDYRNSFKDCNGMVSIFIDKGDSINLVKPIEGEFLDKYLEPLVIEKTEKKFILANQNYDVYMVVYWAKFMGNVSKRKVYEWQEHLKKANQNGQKMRMILVNVDYQQFWGITKDQIPKIDF
jgi:hypothetical protein